ncbi:hypothetical protein PRZ48_010038 [Zasmidium cellare]|uniref:DUF605-domain-containing protein n=1 Tax=Zasmidium cellare TaxID=395010 RepID=A0ABR0EDH1_ZASCE|nr:hypothetical protein PRZ48_010038 [Zasmidium cellare]
MAAVVPTSMKSACPDIHRLAVRAAQLQKFKPIVSYWCEYYILQLILAKELHTADEECGQYAAQLMDKLEQFKDANKGNDAIEDDVASKAYIENFALETFSKGDKAQETNTVTKATPDTFQAAITFMELLNIWGPLEPEIQAKIKYAKFHALRIAKAYKAGEDPNLTNPKVGRPPQEDQVMEDGLEEELKNMENNAGVYKQPTVESAPESALPSRPESTLHHNPPSLPLRTADENALPQEPDISPIDPADNVNSRAGSVGGGYFPSVPDAPSNVNSTGPVTQPPSSTQTFTTSDPTDFYAQPATQHPTAPPPGDLSRPSAPTPHQATVGPSVPQIPTASPAMPVPPPVQAPPAPIQSIPSQPTYGGPPPGGYRTDDDSIIAAQKHAKWAISALNFEDVNTAVKELRIALNSLGAS